MVSALIRWVEQGAAPESVVATGRRRRWRDHAPASDLRLSAGGGLLRQRRRQCGIEPPLRGAHGETWPVDAERPADDPATRCGSRTCWDRVIEAGRRSPGLPQAPRRLARHRGAQGRAISSRRSRPPDSIDTRACSRTAGLAEGHRQAGPRPSSAGRWPHHPAMVCRATGRGAAGLQQHAPPRCRRLMSPQSRSTMRPVSTPSASSSIVERANPDCRRWQARSVKKVKPPLTSSVRRLAAGMRPPGPRRRIESRPVLARLVSSVRLRHAAQAAPRAGAGLVLVVGDLAAHRGLGDGGHLRCRPAA